MNLISILKSLADITRLRIINLLYLNEMNVNEIISVLNMGQSRVSRHLKILSSSNILKSRRDGLWVFYSINKDPKIKSFLDNIVGLLDDELFRKDIQKAKEVLNDSLTISKSYFNRVAENYESFQSEVLGDKTEEIYKIIREIIKNYNSLADLGCGGGSLLKYLISDREDLKLIGVDNSKNMLLKAKKELNNKADLRLGDLLYLPLRDCEVEVVLYNLSLHHLLDYNRSLIEAYRVLKENGMLIISDFVKHNNEFMREKYKDRLLGFDIDEIRSNLEKLNFVIKEIKILDINFNMKLFILSAIKEKKS